MVYTQNYAHRRLINEAPGIDSNAAYVKRSIDVIASLTKCIEVYLISPAAIKIGSLLSWLVMLSTENWEMLSQLLVWISGS